MAFSRVGDVLCAQLQSSDLPAIYASLPKNAQGRVDLKQLLSASRALLTARGATFDVERQLEQLELYDLGHEAQIENGFDERAFCWAMEQHLHTTAAYRADEPDHAEQQTSDSDPDGLQTHRATSSAAGTPVRSQASNQRDASSPAASAGAVSPSAAALSVATESLASPHTPIHIMSPTAAHAATAATAAAAAATAVSPSPAHGRSTSVFHAVNSSTPSAALRLQHNSSTPVGGGGNGGSGGVDSAVQLAELEELYERQSRELDQSRTTLRQQVKVRTEFEQFRREAERREETLNDTVDMLHIALARERTKAKEVNSAYESRVADLSQSVDSTTAALQVLQSEHERLQSDHARLQDELSKSAMLAMELSEERMLADRTAESHRADGRTIERLEKRLAGYEPLVAEHAALQRAHAAALDELAQINAAYEQLHAAYCSEEQLYKEAAARVQQLQQMMNDGKSLQGERNLSTATTSGSLHASEEHESLLDDLLDASSSGTEEQSAPPGEDAPHMPVSTHTHIPAHISVPAPASAPAAPANSALSLPSLPSAQPSPLPSSHPSGAHSPVSSLPPSGMVSPLKRHSFTYPGGWHGGASPLLHAHQPQLQVFHPHPDNSAYINHHFFRLTALAVASHLSCSPQHSSLADAALPLDELYEEAMRKQIHAHKYAQWLDQKLRQALAD